MPTAATEAARVKRILRFNMVVLLVLGLRRPAEAVVRGGSSDIHFRLWLLVGDVMIFLANETKSRCDHRHEIGDLNFDGAVWIGADQLRDRRALPVSNEELKFSAKPGVTAPARSSAIHLGGSLRDMPRKLAAC